MHPNSINIVPEAKNLDYLLSISSKYPKNIIPERIDINKVVV